MVDMSMVPYRRRFAFDLAGCFGRGTLGGCFGVGIRRFWCCRRLARDRVTVLFLLLCGVFCVGEGGGGEGRGCFGLCMGVRAGVCFFCCSSSPPNVFSFCFVFVFVLFCCPIFFDSRFSDPCSVLKEGGKARLAVVVFFFVCRVRQRLDNYVWSSRPGAVCVGGGNGVIFGLVCVICGYDSWLVLS